MEPTDENLRAWDQAHPPAERGEAELPEQVRGSLSDLSGKRVLHIGCGSGAATVEFVERGASVTGIDPPTARSSSRGERGPSVLWIHSELDTVPAELQRARFDLAYVGRGVAQDVRDLDLFAGSISASLKPGGDLLLFDDHPAALCLDGLMHWREDYFAQGFHRLGQLVGALGRHELVVRALEEYPAGPGLVPRLARAGDVLLHARKAR